MRIETYWLARACLGALFIATAAGAQTSDEGKSNTMTLDVLVAEAVRSNPELKFYESELEAARGKRRQAGIWENPEVSSEVGRKSVSGSGLSEEGVAWRVSVTQTFEYRGRMGLRKAIANRDIELAELGLSQFRAALRAEAIVLGHKLVAAQRKAEAATEVAERLRELSEVLVQRDPAGVAPLIETRIVQSGVVAFRKKAIEASEQLQSALFEVNLLRGEALDAPLHLADASVPLTEPAPLEDLLQAARLNNFDIRMRTVELEQQGFQTELSRKQRWPKVSVGPFVEQDDAGERETIAGIGISLPLPLWKSNAGDVEVAKARTSQAGTSLYMTERDVLRAVMEQSLAYRMRLAEMRHWGEDVLKSFRDAAQLGDRHYRLGSLPIGTYMELQREYLDAVEAIVEIESEAVAAREQLAVLTQVPVESWKGNEGAK